MNWLALFALPLLFFLPGNLFSRIVFRSPDSFSPGERWLLPIAFSVCLTTWLAFTFAEFGAFSLRGVTLTVVILCALAWFLARKRLAAWSLIRGVKPDWVFLAIFVLAVFLFAHPAEYFTGNSDAGTYVNIGANIARTGAIAIHDPQVAQLPLDSAKTFYWQLTNPFMLYSYVRLPGFFIANPAQGLVLPQFLHFYPVWLAIWDSVLGFQWGLYATPLIALLASVAFYFLIRELFAPLFETQARATESNALQPNAFTASFRNQRARNLARLAFFLLVVTVPQFWFARYPVAEAMTQFLVLFGMWALVKLERHREASIGLPLLAGICFGEIFFTRADAVLLLMPLTVYALLLIFLRRWQRAHWALFGAFGIVMLQALAHMLVFSPDYLYYQYSHALRMKNIDKLLPGGLPSAQSLFSNPLYIAIILGTVLLGIGALFLVDRVVQLIRTHRGKEINAWALRLEKPLRAAGALLVVAVVIFAYFFWAHPETLFAYVGGLTPLDRSANLIKLGWYLSPIGIVLATLGGVIVLVRDLNTRNLFFFSTAGIFALFYLEDLYSNPHYIYTTRHYIPLVIPLFILLAARALDWLWYEGGAWLAARFRTLTPLRPLVRWTAIGAFALWMLYNLYAMGIVDANRTTGVALRLPFVSSADLGIVHLEPFENSITGVNELGGTYDQLAALDKSLDPNAVLIFSAGRDEPAALATPLTYVFGRDAFVTVFNNPPGAKVAALIDGWRAQGREVVLAYGTNGGKLQIPNYSLEPIGSFSFDVPQWAFAYTFMPRSAWRVNLNYALYRAVPGNSPATYPFTLNFGADDYPALVSGFQERPPEASTRWIATVISDDNKDAKWLSGVILVPQAQEGSNLDVTLRARAPRDNVQLQIKSGGHLLHTISLTQDFNDYHITLNSADLKPSGANSQLELVAQTTPDGAGRLLGAELQSLQITQTPLAIP